MILKVSVIGWWVILMEISFKADSKISCQIKPEIHSWAKWWFLSISNFLKICCSSLKNFYWNIIYREVHTSWEYSSVNFHKLNTPCNQHPGHFQPQESICAPLQSLPQRVKKRILTVNSIDEFCLYLYFVYTESYTTYSFVIGAFHSRDGGMEQGVERTDLPPLEEIFYN